MIDGRGWHGDPKGHSYAALLGHRKKIERELRRWKGVKKVVKGTTIGAEFSFPPGVPIAKAKIEKTF